MAVIVERTTMGSTQYIHPDGYVQESTRPWAYYYDSRPARERSRKPTGWLPPTSYEMLNQVRVEPFGVVRSPQGWIGYGVSEYKPGNQPEMNPLEASASMIARADTEALLALKDQSVNLGVAFAEAQQTANLIGTTARRLGNSYKAVRSGRWKEASNLLGKQASAAVRGKSKTAPSAWLEYQYAWKPLLADVHGSVQELLRSEPYRWLNTVRGQVMEKDSGRRRFSSNVEYDLVWHRESGVYTRLDFQPGNTFFETMSRVGMTNPFEIAWEKVPFSFVVDWFLPVGDWLSTFDATLGWSFLGGSRSVIQRVNYFDVGVRHPSEPWRQLSFEGGGRYKFVRLRRESLAAPPRPVRPHFENPLSLGRMANGLSLLATVFGGRRR